DSGPTRAYRSAKDTHAGALVSLIDVRIDIPSIATFSSTNSMPASARVLASSSLILRDASLMSISPLQKSLNPSPVPGPSTVIATLGWFSLNASATACEIGWTVDEPDTDTSPSRDACDAAGDS